MTTRHAEEIVDCYFVIHHHDMGKTIKAYSYEKKLAQYYMKFHNCKNYELRKVSKPMKVLDNILNESNNDKITIVNIYTRDRKHPGEKELIAVPLTSGEELLIRDDCNEFIKREINYSVIDKVFPYLKDRYKKALSRVFLPHIIQHVCHNNKNHVSKSIDFDQLFILRDFWADEFG